MRKVNLKKDYEEKPLNDVIDSLEFIKNKQRYGFYFMRGMRGITKSDFKTIA